MAEGVSSSSTLKGAWGSMRLMDFMPAVLVCVCPCDPTWVLFVWMVECDSSFTTFTLISQFLTGHLKRGVPSLTQVWHGSASSSQACAPFQAGVCALLLPLAPADKAQGVRLKRSTLWVPWLSGGSALWPPWLGHNKNHLRQAFRWHHCPRRRWRQWGSHHAPIWD